MNFRSSGTAAFLLAAVTVVVTAGCASATASSSGSGTPSTTAVQHSTAVGTVTVGTSVRTSCLRPAGDVLTLASNGKTYCVRVGERFTVLLRGTVSSRWLEPLASSNILKGAPNGALSLVAGMTGASFAGVKPGKVLITSVRPPCSGPLGGRNEAQTKFPVPRVYPLHSCATSRRFLVHIIVVPDLRS